MMWRKVREKIHLRELVPDFFYLFSLLPNDCSMKLLLHDQVFGALVFLNINE